MEVLYLEEDQFGHLVIVVRVCRCYEVNVIRKMLHQLYRMEQYGTFHQVEFAI